MLAETFPTRNAWKTEKHCWQEESIRCTFNEPFKNHCLLHELIIAKLNAYGFNLPTLKLKHSNNFIRKQLNKVKHRFSSFYFFIGRNTLSTTRPQTWAYFVFLSDLHHLISGTIFSRYADDNNIIILEIAWRMWYHCCKKLQKNYCNFSGTIKWKEIQINIIWLLLPMKRSNFEKESDWLKAEPVKSC